MPYMYHLQAAQRAGAPVLLRVGTSAGHGDGKRTAQAIAEALTALPSSKARSRRLGDAAFLPHQ
jgi:hypothetical protein